jgi:hypothetical protein
MTIEKPYAWKYFALGFVAFTAAISTAACKTKSPDGVADAASGPIAERLWLPSSAADLPQTTSHLLDGMDNGVPLSDAELSGRNAWILWTAGNHRFWDYLARHAYGVVDLLKTLSIPRDQRFRITGLINEPGMTKADKADPYGLALDVWEGAAPTDQPDPKIYGRSSGVVGLRIFDNPDFDDKAKAHWDPQKYVNDPVYASDPSLVRPYAVGVSCGLCHVSFNPIKPPADPANPKYENLSSYIGAEYFWVSRVFGKDLRPENFVYQLMESSPPGSLDTSLISSDSINNPRTMNAIFQVGARLGVAKTLSTYEKETGATTLVPGVRNGVPGVQEGLTSEGTLLTPHILKDGADSVGLAGALSRVFINIGEYHEEWVKHFKPLIGGTETPMSVDSANRNSPYWNATTERLPNLAAFFLKTAKPLHLKDAPGGKAYLDASDAVERGKLVFADNCARCHSSKQPPDAPASPGYFDQSLQNWTQSAPYKQWMRAEVMKPDFRDDNFFSTDMRYSIKQVGTNACAAAASNAIRGHVWDTFSSETYKSLPAVGDIDVVDPIDGHRYKWSMPAGGRGYLRAPSLVSLWASAPFFVSNTLGKLEYAYDADKRAILKDDVASVDARMRVFNDAIQQLLWPEKREKDPYINAGKIFRTNAESYLTVSVGVLPEFLKTALVAAGHQEIKIGPIPKGTPVNLLSNLDMTAGDPDSRASRKDLISAIGDLGAKLLEIKIGHLSEEQSIKKLEEVVPALLKVNTCPDFEVNRGHLFGTKLPDSDKKDLIAFLKTL